MFNRPAMRWNHLNHNRMAPFPGHSRKDQKELAAMLFMVLFPCCQPFVCCEAFRCVHEPIQNEAMKCEPLFWMPDEKVHNCEKFLHLWTFSKKNHKLCPKTLVVSNRFVNRFLSTLFFLGRFLSNSSQVWTDLFCCPFVQHPKIYEPIWQALWTHFVNPFDKHSALGALVQVLVCVCCEKPHDHSLTTSMMNSWWLMSMTMQWLWVVDSATKQKTNKNTNGCLLSVAAGPCVGGRWWRIVGSNSILIFLFGIQQGRCAPQKMFCFGRTRA